MQTKHTLIVFWHCMHGTLQKRQAAKRTTTASGGGWPTGAS
jgi:hypothetical protein